MKPLVVLALAGLAAVGCGSGDDDDRDSTAAPAARSASPSGSDERPQEQVVVDPCTVLSDPELSSFGLILERKRTVSELDAHGCGWSGREFGITVTVNPEPIAGYLSRRDETVFDHMTEIEISGRPAIEYDLVTHQDDCGIRVDAGSGSIGVGAGTSGLASVPRDPCADARRVMELVASKLPAQGG